MIDLFLNSLWFRISAIVVYSILFIYILLKISQPFRLFITGLTEKILQQQLFNNLREILRKFIIIPFSKSLNKFTDILNKSGIRITGAEGFFAGWVKPSLTGPVNFTALVFRKLYNENLSAVIGISSGIIVVFYIILSIF